ncbi:hypothetical protein QOZ80_1BG0092200 [Eleusine coracana subsp. coracana]|nr:hypothetical protein QOZ80_1BG0092200 [Eleusine coracana subsp. coracana]
MANIRIVSSLAEVDQALQDLNINAINQAAQVRFCLHEHASLKEASKMKLKTRPGRHGFRFLNPELLDCKCKAKVQLEECYTNMLRTSMTQFDQELIPLEARIGVLKHLMLSTDDQIQHTGPPVNTRNRGVQQMLYPNPPFPEDPEYDCGDADQLVAYQAAYNTQAEIDAAVSHDKHAQRAFWNANLLSFGGEEIRPGEEEN